MAGDNSSMNNVGSRGNRGGGVPLMRGHNRGGNNSMRNYSGPPNRNNFSGGRGGGNNFQSHSGVGPIRGPIFKKNRPTPYITDNNMRPNASGDDEQYGVVQNFGTQQRGGKMYNNVQSRNYAAQGSNTPNRFQNFSNPDDFNSNSSNNSGNFYNRGNKFMSGNSGNFNNNSGQDRRGFALPVEHQQTAPQSPPNFVNEMSRNQMNDNLSYQRRNSNSNM